MFPDLRGWFFDIFVDVSEREGDQRSVKYREEVTEILFDKYQSTIFQCYEQLSVIRNVVTMGKSS